VHVRNTLRKAPTRTRPIKMSRIEELVYSAHEYGKRTELFDEVTKIKLSSPTMHLEDVYDQAYQNVMKT